MKNREIKFKIWDKKEKKMSLPFGFGDLYGYEGEMNAVTLHHPFSSEGQDFDIASHDGGGRAYPQFGTENEVNKDLEFLQFAGIKDKTGKEIYEWDILSVDGENMLVVWDSGNLQWIVRSNLEAPIPMRISIDGKRPDLELWYVIEDGADSFVIGNIYENPELLSPTNK